MKKQVKNRKSETGGAGVKFLAVLTVLFLIAHAAYNYIPVGYEAESLKQEMQTAVVQSVAMPGVAMPLTEAIKIKIKKAVANNNIPADALIEVKPVNNVVQARVAYTKKINILPFGIYKYNYQFDHTATPTGFLFKNDKTL